MERPIVVWNEEYNVSNGDPDLDEELEWALLCDEKERFVSRVNDCICCEDEADRVLISVFENDAVNCLAAVMNGETEGIVHCSASAYPCYSVECTRPPLHIAARFRAPKITRYLLENGADPNLRADSRNVKNALALNVIVDNLRFTGCLPDWLCPLQKCSWFSGAYDSLDWMTDPIPEGPDIVFKSIFYLNHPFLRRFLETLRLLAQKTEKTAQEILNYVKDRKIFELTALLLVAREKAIPDQETRLKIDDFLITECASVNRLLERSKYTSDRDRLVQQCLQKKMEFDAILFTLEMFDRIGDRLTAYLRMERDKLQTYVMAREIAWIFEEAGFDMKLKLLDETYRNPWEFDCSSTFLDRKSSEPGFYDFVPMRPNSVDKLASICGTPNQQPVVSSSSWSQGSSAAAARSFHTFHPVRVNKRFDYATPVDVLWNGVPDLQCKQQCPVRAGQDLPSTIWVPNMQYKNKWACFMATLKRRIRYI